MISTTTELTSESNSLDRLNAVIGLVKLNDIDSAREETMRLILSSLSESSSLEGTDFYALTSTEVSIVKTILKSYYQTIEYSLSKYFFLIRPHNK